MNLYKKTYVGNKWRKPAEQLKIKGKGIKQERVTEVTEDIGYWRKANQIHNWFIQNCAEGIDDCKDTYVEKEQLEELLKIVNIVLKSSKLVKGKVYNGTRYENGKSIEIYEDGLVMENKRLAEELLPIAEGFFFGGTNYDQYYYEDLEQTKEILENALKEEDGDFYYRASW